jgi:hypothetical protein
VSLQTGIAPLRFGVVSKGKMETATPIIRRARFTGEVLNPSALCVAEQSVPPFQQINLYDLGTTGLMQYVAGQSPFHPHEPLTGKPTREWRLKQACLVIESRAGVDTGARERFIAACDRSGS